MSSDGSFADVFSGLGNASPEAARKLYERFAQRLVALAHMRLDALIRRKEDPEDVVQSVFKSFFRRQADGEFRLQGWNEVWTLLVTITVRKCAGRAEHFRAGRRNIHSEQSLAASGDSSAGWVPESREPTPAEAALFMETVERIMSELNDREREIVGLVLQGCDPQEISRRINRTERTVYRVLEHVKERLTTFGAEGDDSP